MKFFIYCVALFGLIFGLVGCLFLWTQVLRGRKQAQAEIIVVEIESFENNGGDVTSTAYRAKYRVRYETEGRYYELPATGSHSSATHDAALAKSRLSPVGSLRPIYYLPGRPENFSLDPLGRRFGISMIFVAVGLTVLGASILLW